MKVYWKKTEPMVIISKFNLTQSLINKIKKRFKI